MKLPFLVITLLTAIYGKTQVVRQPLSVTYKALNAYSKKFRDIFSGTANQASLADLEAGGFAAYGEKRFMLDELKAFTAVLAIPTKSGTIGFQGDYFGSAGFNESQLGLLYARKLTGKLDVGVKFNYNDIRVAGYGSVSGVSFEVGAIWHVTESLHAGIHVYNPTGSDLGKTSDEKLASMYKAGVGYEVSSQVFLSAEVVKNEQMPVGVNAGLQYNIHEKISLKSSWSTPWNLISAGISYQLAFARVDVFTSYHQQLGLTPGILLLFNFKKIEQ